MTSLYGSIKDRVKKRALYNHTVAELKSTNLATQLDLDIYYDDIPQIARRAIYGK